MGGHLGAIPAGLGGQLGQGIASLEEMRIKETEYLKAENQNLKGQLALERAKVSVLKETLSEVLKLGYGK